MKKKFLLRNAIIGAFVFAIGGVAVLAQSPNYGTSTETLQLIYDGYVQCQPSYNDAGRHAARGYFVYRNGTLGEKWWYTEYGRNANDSNIYSVSGRYLDDLNPDAPKVTFNYNFDYVPSGSQIWPVSIEVVD